MRKISLFLLQLSLSLLAGAVQFMPKTVINGEFFSHIEVVATDEGRARGLMERTSLPEDGGMCFVMDSIGPATFWMKNTRIPLDAIFIDPYGVVLKIATMAVERARGASESEQAYENRLTRYSCPGPVYCVLELHAGSANRLGITEGSLLHQFSLSSLNSFGK